jgi:hypothetical protein
MKYPEMDWHTMEAIVDKLGGIAGARRFLAGELTVTEASRFWREENDVIFFSLTSDGTTGPEWVERLEKKGFQVSEHAKRMLYSPAFEPTSGVATEIAVLKGVLFEDTNRISKTIRAEARKRKLTNPNAEVACLIRELLMHDELEAMGLWGIVVMHEPIMDSFRYPDLFRAIRVGVHRQLGSCDGGSEEGWRRDNGFAFVVA